MKRRPPVQGPITYGRAADVRDPGDRPRSVVPPGEGWAWRAVRGLFVLVAVAAGLAIGALGIWLWSSYRPAHLADLSIPPTVLAEELADVDQALDAYGTAWVVLGLASVAWLGVALVSSPTSRRILATGALVALAGGALVAWTAPHLVWEDAVVTAPEPEALVGLRPDAEVAHYVVDGREVEPGTYEALLAGHVLGASLVVTGLLAGGLLARARRRRPDDGAVPLRP